MSKLGIKNEVWPKVLSVFDMNSHWENAWWECKIDLIFEQSIDAPDILPAGSCFRFDVGRCPQSWTLQTITYREFLELQS